MTPQEFREILDRVGISQSEAARRLYRPFQTINRWANGHSPIPKMVAEGVKKWPKQRRTLP